MRKNHSRKNLWLAMVGMVIVGAIIFAITTSSAEKNSQNGNPAANTSQENGEGLPSQGAAINQHDLVLEALQCVDNQEGEQSTLKRCPLDREVYYLWESVAFSEQAFSPVTSETCRNVGESALLQGSGFLIGATQKTTRQSYQSVIDVLDIENVRVQLVCFRGDIRDKIQIPKNTSENLVQARRRIRSSLPIFNKRGS